MLLEKSKKICYYVKQNMLALVPQLILSEARILMEGGGRKGKIINIKKKELIMEFITVILLISVSSAILLLILGSFVGYKRKEI